MNARHPVFKQDLYARLFRRNLQRPHKTIAGGGCGPDSRINGFARLNHGPIHRGGMHLAIDRVADRDSAEIVRGSVKTTP